MVSLWPLSNSAFNNLACQGIPAPTGGIYGVGVRAISVHEEATEHRFSKGLCFIFLGFAYVQHKDPIGNRVCILI